MSFVLGAVALIVLTAPLASALETLSSDQVSESDGSGAEIRSDPSGAEVYVNGVLRGKTPLSLTDLVPGPQVLRLEKDGYQTRKAVVALPSGKRLSVFFDMEETTGTLVIDAVVDNSPNKGETVTLISLIDGVPASIGTNEVKEGFHIVTVRAFGYEDESRNIYVRGGWTESLRVVLRPAAFRLGAIRTSRKNFNPRNPGLLGVANLSFAVNANGNASVSVRAADGSIVYEKSISSFTSWEQIVPWTGRNSDGTPLPDGMYRVVVSAASADGATERTTETRVSIDSTISIKPTSVAGAIGGPLFVPDARTLPEGSFQFDSIVLFGEPYGSSAAFSAPPFAFGLRFAPLDDRTEVAGSFIIDASKTGSAAMSFAFSVKRLLTQSSGAQSSGAWQPTIAAAMRWAYSEINGESPFGSPSGAELFLPIEISVGKTEAAVSFRFAPSLLWEGPRGVPLSAIPLPVAGVGLGFRGAFWTVDFSSRTEIRIQNGTASINSMLLGCEARFFPPPSVFYGSVFGGSWLSGDRIGFFGGTGIGIVY